MSSWLQKSVNLLLPPLCSLCKAPVNDPQKLCTSCWSELSFIQKPFCVLCGYPFEYDMGEGAQCNFCMDSPPSYDHMRSAFQYEGVVKKLLLGFKHGDRTDFLPLLVGWLSTLYHEDPELSADLILPVPIHKGRLFKRRYNQAALLADGLAKKVNLPSDSFLLKRIKKTPPQTGTRQERLQNVKKAFLISERDLVILKEKTILLIDDVVTTGATIEACASTLKKAGANQVKVLSLARVVL